MGGKLWYALYWLFLPFRPWKWRCEKRHHSYTWFRHLLHKLLQINVRGTCIIIMLVNHLNIVTSIKKWTLWDTYTIGSPTHLPWLGFRLGSKPRTMTFCYLGHDMAGSDKTQHNAISDGRNGSPTKISARPITKKSRHGPFLILNWHLGLAL